MNSNKLILGTVQFGLNYGISNQSGKMSFQDAIELIDYARFLNLNTLDTAIAYGESEKVLGQIGVSDWNVITKLPSLENISDKFSVEKTIINFVSISLNNLKIKKLGGLLLHNANNLLSRSGQWIYESLLKLKSEDLVNKVGISIYDPLILDQIFLNFDLDIVQAPFNILDRRMVDDGWSKKLKSKGIEFHARSVFLQGLLLMNQNEMPKWFSQWNSIWEELDIFIKVNNISNLELCLGFIKNFEEIDYFVIGVENKKHLETILKIMNLPLKYLPETKSTDPNLILPSNWETN